MTPYSRKKHKDNMKGSTFFRPCNFGYSRIDNLVFVSWAFVHCNFSWLNLGTLSKDHTEKHNANRDKNDIILRIENLKNPTLARETYLYSIPVKEYTPCPI